MNIGSTTPQVADAGSAQRDLMLSGAQTASSSRDEAKIAKAGHDFESLLLGQWLTSAEQTFAQAPGGADDSEDEDGSRDQFLGMAMQQLASSIVDHGGIGISKMIIDNLHRKGSSTAPKGAPTAGEPAKAE